MLAFSPRDPFPIIAEDEISLRMAEEHSAAVDQWLGFRLKEIEISLDQSGCRLKAPESSGQEQRLWIGLDTQRLLTPYVELRKIFTDLRLQPGEHLVDLGMAYARAAFVLARHFPTVEFTGYEYVGERLREAQRVLQKAVPDEKERRRYRLEHADLSHREFSPVQADVYLLYDYGSAEAIEKTIFDLRRISRIRPIRIVARGRTCRMQIERHHNDWLCRSESRPQESTRTIYRSL